MENENNTNEEVIDTSLVSEEIEVVEQPVEQVKEEKNDKPKKDKKKNKKKKIIIIIIVILILICGGIFAYFKFSKPEVKVEKNETKKKEVKSELRMTGNDLQDFDLKFLQMESGEKNVVYSPLSIKYTLAMLQEGAKGETKDQIKSVIGDYKSKKYVNSANLALANAMYIKNDIKGSIKQSYTDNLFNKYNAEVIYDDFKSAANVNNWIKNKSLNLLDNVVSDEQVANFQFMLVNALAINMDWNNQIQAQGNNSGVKSINYNVVYDHEKYSDYVGIITMPGEFHTLSFNNGKKNVKSAQIAASINNYDIVKELGEDNIRKFIEEKYREYLKNPNCGEENSDEEVKKFLDYYIKKLNENYKKVDYSTDFNFYVDDNYKVFAKDLKTYDNTTLQYIGVMPTKQNLDEFVKNSNASSINDLIKKIKPVELSSFDYGKVYKMKGYIPFFDYEYEIKPIKSLKEIGISDVFDSKKSDLSELSSEKGAYISDVIHKSNIEFTNDGIRAAAATVGGGLGAASCPTYDYLYDVPLQEIDLTFDKPFMYIIRDKATGEVWFTGKVYEPSTEYNY